MIDFLHLYDFTTYLQMSLQLKNLKIEVTRKSVVFSFLWDTVYNDDVTEPGLSWYVVITDAVVVVCFIVVDNIDALNGLIAIMHVRLCCQRLSARNLDIPNSARRRLWCTRRHGNRLRICRMA